MELKEKIKLFEKIRDRIKKTPRLTTCFICNLVEETVDFKKELYKPIIKEMSEFAYPRRYRFKMVLTPNEWAGIINDVDEHAWWDLREREQRIKFLESYIRYLKKQTKQKSND